MYYVLRFFMLLVIKIVVNIINIIPGLSLLEGGVWIDLLLRSCDGLLDEPGDGVVALPAWHHVTLAVESNRHPHPCGCLMLGIASSEIYNVEMGIISCR